MPDTVKLPIPPQAEPQPEPELPPERQPEKKTGKKRKKKAYSAKKQIWMTVGICAGLFVVVSLLTWIALKLRQKNQNSLTEQRNSPSVMEARTFPTSTTKKITSTTATTTTGTVSSVTGTATTTSETGTTTTTTLLTRYIPGEDEFPYFTRDYTYPDEAGTTSAKQTTTTTAKHLPPADPDYDMYSSYGAALKQFLLNLGEGDTEPMYALTDLNGDRVPELIISGGITEDARHAVYAYTDDKLTELKSEFGEYNGRLYISEGEESPVLIEICMVETTTYTYYYTFDGKRLGLQHSFCDDNGTYSADGNAVSAQEYAEAMYLQPELDAGREIALPGDAESITEVGGHGI